jgi:hypothetical protein
MHRSLSRRLVVLVFVIFSVLPASAAVRQDDLRSGLFQRIIRRIVTVLEDIKGSLPTVTTPPPAG